MSHESIENIIDRIRDVTDTPWFQRLRDISQTANTRLVYMFSEHSRFGHCLGVAYLAKLALAKLASYRALLMDKLQADYLSPQELFSIQDELIMIDKATEQLTECLEYLLKPISY